MNSKFPGATTSHGNTTTIYETIHRFQEEDAADGNSFAPSDPSRSTRQFPSSNTAQSMRVRKCTYMTKRGRPYHKTVAIIFAPCLLQIGDDKVPHADDVGYNINKMRHTQFVGQNGLFQSGARGQPITCLSTLQPIHDELGHRETVQATEHAGSCPL